MGTFYRLPKYLVDCIKNLSFVRRATSLPPPRPSLESAPPFFFFQMDKLLQPTVWLDAANQVFYSYGLAFGSIIGFGSYNPVDKNCVKDVYIITAANVFTAIYACAVVFSILGFKAQHLFEKCMAQ